MMSHSLSDAALVLVGHGSTRERRFSRADLPARGRIAPAQNLRPGAGGFLETGPYLAQVLRGVFAPRVFIVPLFISEGYFTEEVIPRELGFCGNGQTNFSRVATTRRANTCITAGRSARIRGMTEVLLARAREIVEKFPFPRAPKPAETALFIAGHGTGNNENSRKAIEDQVELIRAKGHLRGSPCRVHGGGTAHRRLLQAGASENIVMVPFFISDGLHSFEDIPVMLGAPKETVRERLKAGQPTWRNPTEREGKRRLVHASIGSEPLMADVILERVAEAAVQNKNGPSHLLKDATALWFLSLDYFWPRETAVRGLRRLEQTARKPAPMAKRSKLLPLSGTAVTTTLQSTNSPTPPGDVSATNNVHWPSGFIPPNVPSRLPICGAYVPVSVCPTETGALLTFENPSLKVTSMPLPGEPKGGVPM